MITAAIVAEFNPLHNGHKYLIDEVKKSLGADRIIVIMSGDFVQRGQPAVMSKQLRAKCAVDEGVDLVLMLPTVYALSGADMFALSSVSLLDKLSCVDYLCFASECGDISLLEEITNKLYPGGYEINPDIKELLAKGMTYAKARSILFPEYESVLNLSNNILAIEYIRALKEINSSIKPFTIKRIGQDYNDVSVDNDTNASATGIRNLLLDEDENICDDLLRQQLPPASYKIITEQKKETLPIDINMFSEELYYAVLANKDSLTDYLDINDSLANKIINSLLDYKDITSFADSLKSKELTYARISRAFMHILLNIKGDNDYHRNAISQIKHIRILSLNKDARELMKIIDEKSNVKLFSSISKVSEELNDTEKALFATDLFAATLYDHIVRKIYGTKQIRDYSKKL